MTLIMLNKANLRKAQMNVNSFITKEYSKKNDFAVQKNKANTNPIKANFTSAQKGKTAVRGQMSALDPLFSINERGEKNRSPRLLIDPMLPLYKPGNNQYYIRYICRCSSMVERSFRKAEVVGPTPTIGFGPYWRCLLAAMDVSH